MFKMLKYIPVMVLALLSGCIGAQPDSPGDCESLTLVLNISDLKAESRSSDADGDPINTLRVVIARPDGVIEVNRMLYPAGNALTGDDLRFKIKTDIHKWIFLVCNEAAMDADFSSFPNFDPDMLRNPGSTSAHPIDAVLTSLPESGASVPMSAVYQLGTSLDLADKVGDGVYEIRYSLSLMRTVTRFTFNIVNARKIPVHITEIGIDNVKAGDYYLFPRVKGADGAPTVHYLTAQGADVKESGTGRAPVDESGAPGSSPFSEHFRRDYVASSTADGYHIFSAVPLEIAALATPLVLERYYYESNLPDDADTLKPYSLYVDFDGNRYITPLDNLPTLPRNTHVVINIQFTNNDKILEIEVLPYYSVDLNPGFGKKDD